MILAEDLWLRGKAAQASMLQLLAYNTAFAGTATLQAWKLGLSAPTGFWQAMGRVGAANETPDDAPAANVVDLPKMTAKKAAPKKPKAVKTAPATPKAAEAIALKTKAPKAKAAPKAAKPKAAKPKAKPVPALEPIDLGPSPHLLDAPRGGKADDLTALTGVGAKLATALNEFGIYHFDQIATLDAEGVEWLNEQQKGFKMLAARYGLVEQAKARLA